MEIEESRMNFIFETEDVVKFDEVKFFNQKYQNLKDSKGVDFLVNYDDTLWFIEVKNFEGYERENRDRLKLRNKDVESLEIEIASKVRSTVACLVGAKNMEDLILQKYFDQMNRAISNNINKLKVVLILEGNIGRNERETKVKFQQIKTSIKSYLNWLGVEVFVENSEFHRSNNLFRIEKY